MARGVGGISPRYRGILEVSQDDLVSTARRNKAPDEILNMIERLPDGEFGGPQEVQRAYGDIT